MENYVIFKVWRAYPSMEFVDSEIVFDTTDAKKAVRRATGLNLTDAHYWLANPWVDEPENRMYECVSYEIAITDEETGSTLAWIEPEELGFDVDELPRKRHDHGAVVTTYLNGEEVNPWEE